MRRGLLDRHLRNRRRVSRILLALLPAYLTILAIRSELAIAESEALGTTQGDDGAWLEDLSLEELLELRLGAMSISGIHHAHDAGEWMMGYSFMHMSMEGNLDGTKSLSSADIFADGYMVAPTSMDMQMHMFHMMLAPTNYLTMSLMMPYVRKSMRHLVNPGAAVPFAGDRFTTRSEGPGDLKISFLLSLYESEHHRLIADGGWSFPTGSIDESDTTPMSMGSSARLPYPMQLGSGTFDAHPGMTYLGQWEDWAWGMHARGILRMGENENDYRLGHEWSATAWGARAVAEFLSMSLRLEGRGWEDIHGADSALNPAMVPTADPELRAGERLDLLFGVNVFSIQGRLSGNRLAVEAGLPVYQSLDGPQLETDWRLQVAWDWTFDSFFGWGR